MFGRKSRRALELRILELEAICAGVEVKERELQVLRDDYAQKIQDLQARQLAMDVEKKAFEEQCKEQERALARTLAAREQAARKELERTIEAERIRAAETLKDRATGIQESYVYFLSQMKLMMEMVTKAAGNTTELFFTEEKVDVFQRFCKEIDISLGKNQIAGDGSDHRSNKSALSGEKNLDNLSLTFHTDS